MNIAFAPIGLLILLIVPASIVGVIVLLIKGGPAVRWFFGILVLLLIIGFFGLFSMRFVSHGPVVMSQLTPPQVPVQEGSVYIEKDPTLWSDGLEEELTPDVYSGLDTAAYGLGIQLYDTIQAALKDETLQKIVIRDFNVPQAVQEQLRQGLSTNYPDIDIVINQQSNISPGEIHIELTLASGAPRRPLVIGDDVDSAFLTDNFSSPKGVLTAAVLTADDKHVKEVKYHRCIWLYDPDLFRSKVNGQGQWAVITSDEAAVTKEQAQQQVRQAAMEYLANQLQIGSRVGTAVRDSDLWDYGLVADEYSQRLVGLSGPIWRAALLLDVSPERIQTLRQQKMVVQHQARNNWIQHFLSLIGMLVLITILYVFVNAITKGYYSKTILIVSILGFLVFLFLFWA